MGEVSGRPIGSSIRIQVSCLCWPLPAEETNRAGWLVGLAEGQPVYYWWLMSELQVMAVMYDASKWICRKVEKLPRSYRFTLGDRLINTALDLYLLLVEAQYTKDRQSILTQANLELEKLRHLLRLTLDLTALSLKSYQYISEQINQVGKMIGSWRRND